MRRTIDREERLDGALDDPVALRGTLSDLRRINRWLGGAGLSAGAVEALVRARLPLDDTSPIRFLDVGTGAADIPAMLVARWSRRTPALQATGIDTRHEILEAARSIAPGLRRLEDHGDLRLDLGDGRALPYPDAAFDVVHCSLVLHHLDPGEVAALLAEMRRVARWGVVVNDLVRGRPALVGAWALTRAITRNPYTRHDGPLSVRRAYSRMELRAMVEAAGLTIIWKRAAILGHRVALAAGPA